MAVSSSSLLDHKSSTIHQPLPSTYRANLLAKNHTAMAKAVRIYDILSFETGSGQYHRLLRCRTDAYFYRNKITGNVRVGANSCHLRFCPLCSKTRELRVRENTANWLKKTKYPKFMTLTLAHSTQRLDQQLKRLYDAFRHIRRLHLFANNAKGGIWFFQIKKSKTDGLWHPHLHCVLEGGYISQKALSKAWLAATGDSMIVDIRMIKSIKSASDYVARYAASPCYLPDLEDFDAIELAQSLKGRRICGTFGSARQARLTSAPDYDRNEWEYLGGWRTVIELVEFDDFAKAIFDAWRLNRPLDRSIDIDRYNSFIKNQPPPPKPKRPDPQLYFEFMEK